MTGLGSLGEYSEKLEMELKIPIEDKPQTFVVTYYFIT